MAGEINRVPQGLLSLLDMKARGQSPRTLSAETQAQIDILDLYLSQNRRVLSAIDTINSTAFSASFSVPNTQMWVLYGVGTQSSALAAATTLRATWAIRKSPTSTPVPFIMIGEPTSFTTGESVRFGFQTRVLLLPGDVLGFYPLSFAGTAVSVTQFAEVAALEL